MTTATAPISKNPAAEGLKPFCSQRCADLDLGRWLKGSYRVETNEAPETQSAENPDFRTEN